MDDQNLRLDSLVYTNKCISASTLVKDLVDLFKNEKDKFITIVDRDRIVGLVGKEKFLQKIGARYGWALYAEKDVGDVLASTPLVLDGATDPSEALKHVVSRPEDEIYDDIMVSTDGRFAGLVAVKDLMILQLQRMVEQVRKVSEQREVLRETIATHLLDRRIEPNKMTQKVDAIVDMATELRHLETAAQQKGESEAGFRMEGKLELFSPVDLLQLLVQGGKSGKLLIWQGSATQYAVFLTDGSIVHAEGAGLKGVDALFQAVMLQSGSFDFSSTQEATEVTIEGDSIGLLLQACQRQDEMEPQTAGV